MQIIETKYFAYKLICFNTLRPQKIKPSFFKDLATLPTPGGVGLARDRIAADLTGQISLRRSARCDGRIHRNRLVSGRQASRLEAELAA